MTYLEGLNKIIEAMGKRELDQNAQQTTYLGLITMQLATIADELARMNGSVRSEVHCACTDEEIVKPYLEAIEAEAIKYSGTGEVEVQAYDEGLLKAIEIIKNLLSEQED